MSIEVTIQLENLERFNAAIKRAKSVTSDLTIPLTLIAKNWFQGNKAIFKLAGPGKYEDLSPKYKIEKQRKYGFIYPILKATGAIEDSITDPKNSKAISEIINKDTLLLGSKVPYGVYHQGPGKRHRPFVFVGPESPYAVSGDQKNRPQIWLSILNDFVLQKLKQEVGNG